jgi:hypothetical protein
LVEMMDKQRVELWGDEMGDYWAENLACELVA